MLLEEILKEDRLSMAEVELKIAEFERDRMMMLSRDYKGCRGYRDYRDYRVVVVHIVHTPLGD
jgi:hypothetical protein